MCITACACINVRPVLRVCCMRIRFETRKRRAPGCEREEENERSNTDTHTERSGEEQNIAEGRVVGMWTAPRHHMLYSLRDKWVRWIIDNGRAAGILLGATNLQGITEYYYYTKKAREETKQTTTAKKKLNMEGYGHKRDQKTLSFSSMYSLCPHIFCCCFLFRFLFAVVAIVVKLFFSFPFYGHDAFADTQ